MSQGRFPVARIYESVLQFHYPERTVAVESLNDGNGTA